MKLKLLPFSFVSILVLLSLGANCQALKLGRTAVPCAHLVYESNVGDSIIKLDGYAVIFSFKRNLPLYTFHRLTKDQITIQDRSNRTAAKRSSSFRPWLLSTNRLSATNADYKQSGYDRGHMVPAGDFLWNKRLKDETFWYLNINPQSANLNRGMWASLENEIRKLVIKSGNEIFVVTGVVFSSSFNKRIGPNKLPVPASFFKLIYSPTLHLMAAFLFDNTIDTYSGSLTDFQVSVDFIESITGEDFFDLLDHQSQRELESNVHPMHEIKND